MEENQILWMLKLLPFIGGGLSAGLFGSIWSGYHPERFVLTKYKEISGFLQKREREWSGYQRLESWLKKNGATFHYGKGMTASRFIRMQILMGLAGFLTVCRIELIYGGIAAVVLMFLPAVLLEYSNRKDNERMLPEIKLIYHGLELQIRAGVYVMNALSECYGSVQEERLRQALIDLAGDIVMKADIYAALERFQEKFDNAYIDSLCITILQALESGQALSLLGDIGEQIKDMEAAVMERKKAALDRSITFYQLGVLVVILGIALYACVTYLFQAAVRF